MSNPKDDEIKEDNNSDSVSIKSTDSKLGLGFLEYGSEEENSPPLQSQTGEEVTKIEESGVGDMDQNSENQEEKENNSDEEVENKKRGNNILHCAYCGLSSETHLAQCLECKKWFCNGKLDAYSPSMSFSYYISFN